MSPPSTMHRYSTSSAVPRSPQPPGRARRSTSGGAGTPKRATVFRRLDYPLWRQTAHNPVRMLWLIAARTARGRGGRPGVPGALRRAHRRARRGARGARHAGGRTACRSSPARPIAYFSAEFALHQSLPIYAGGLGVLAGDHCKEAERPRRAAHRRRLHVSAGLLPPARLGRRLAGGELRAAELGGRADRAGARRPTASRASPPCRSATARCSSRSGACASAASRCTCSTPTSRRTRRGIASCRRGSTAAIARRASSRRSSSASAASAR